MRNYFTKPKELFSIIFKGNKISGEIIPTLLRLGKTSLIPIIIAVIWSIISYFNITPIKERSILSAFKDFITSLFFIMWFVGQYQRTFKSISDSSNFANLQTSIGDIRAAISQLRQIPIPTPKTATTVKNQLFIDAKKAVDNGHILAGLMQAGVAFEQAILEKASKINFFKDNRTTIGYMLNKLSGLYDDGTRAELLALWQLRNKLIHITNDAANELKDNPNLINYFEWGILELEKAE